jgi:hypothetical protein
MPRHEFADVGSRVVVGEAFHGVDYPDPDLVVQAA